MTCNSIFVLLVISRKHTKPETVTSTMTSSRYADAACRLIVIVRESLGR